MAPRVFLLSPARIGGPRSKLLLGPNATGELAARLQRGVATYGEVYAFISSLYFRGKVAYSEVFAAAPHQVPAASIIVPARGLVSLNTPVSAEELRMIGDVSIESNHRAYRTALLRDARLCEQQAGPECRFVLLGSIATDKYTAPLLEVFGQRLMFPADFVGRGDMSRGGLMLRAANSGVELEYISLAGAVRHGPRPPKLTPLRQKVD
jgi:hypothetical protein